MPADDGKRKSKPVVKADKDVMLQRVPPGGRKEDWIESQLRHVYDDALDEAIPDDMLALLGQLDKAPDDPPSPDENQSGGDTEDRS